MSGDVDAAARNDAAVMENYLNRWVMHGHSQAVQALSRLVAEVEQLRAERQEWETIAVRTAAGVEDARKPDVPSRESLLAQAEQLRAERDAARRERGDLKAAYLVVQAQLTSCELDAQRLQEALRELYERIGHMPMFNQTDRQRVDYANGLLRFIEESLADPLPKEEAP